MDKYVENIMVENDAEDLTSVSQQNENSMITLSELADSTLSAVSIANEDTIEDAIIVEQQSENLIDVTQESEDSIMELSEVNDDNCFVVATSEGEVIVENGYSPYLNRETMTWFEYDIDQKKFVDTGVSIHNVDMEYLRIGPYNYNGSVEITIPIYAGTIATEEIETTAEVTASLASISNMTLSSDSAMETTAATKMTAAASYQMTQV